MDTIIELKDVENIDSNTLVELQATLNKLPIPLRIAVKFDNEGNWFWNNVYQITISVSDYLCQPEVKPQYYKFDYTFTINADNESDALDAAVDLLETNPNKKYIFLDEIVRLPELDQQSKEDITLLINTDQTTNTIFAGKCSRILNDDQIKIRDITDIVRKLKR